MEQRRARAGSALGSHCSAVTATGADEEEEEEGAEKEEEGEAAAAAAEEEEAAGRLQQWSWLLERTTTGERDEGPGAAVKARVTRKIKICLSVATASNSPLLTNGGDQARSRTTASAGSERAGWHSMVSAPPVGVTAKRPTRSASTVATTATPGCDVRIDEAR